MIKKEEISGSRSGIGSLLLLFPGCEWKLEELKRFIQMSWIVLINHPLHCITCWIKAIWCQHLKQWKNQAILIFLLRSCRSLSFIHLPRQCMLSIDNRNNIHHVFTPCRTSNFDWYITNKSQHALRQKLSPKKFLKSGSVHEK